MKEQAATSIQQQPALVKDAPISWRDVLPIHPAADLFPLMSPDELRVLGEDIKKNGLKIPIVGCNHNGFLTLLDGRNRLDAMELVGLPVIKNGECNYDRINDRIIRWSGCMPGADPYAYVISANIHRRHLTQEQKRELIANLLKATPEKSDRQISATVKASPTTVGAVRAELEANGDVSKLDTRTDSKGREQPAKKPRVPRRLQHVCWHCGAVAPVGEVQQHSYLAYEDADVWLHDSCVAAFEAREAAAATDSKPAAGDDIGPASSGELERLRARVDELQAEVRRRDIKITGLESEIEECKSHLIRELRKVSADAECCPHCGGNIVRIAEQQRGAP